MAFKRISRVLWLLLLLIRRFSHWRQARSLSCRFVIAVSPTIAFSSSIDYYLNLFLDHFMDLLPDLRLGQLLNHRRPRLYVLLFNQQHGCLLSDLRLGLRLNLRLFRQQRSPRGLLLDLGRT